MQLIILGMHSSGTSMAARLINMMGVYFGPEGISIGFDKNNPKGFWERQDVMSLNESLLKRRDCAWNRVDNWEIPEQPPSLAPKISRSIQTLVLDLDAHRPWFIKDPRLCLTLPFWTPFLEMPVAIIVYRDPLEIAESLFRRNAIPHAYGLALWEAYGVHLMNAARNLPRLHVRHADLLADPVRSVSRLHASLRELDVLGLRLPSAREITAFVDPALYRAKKEAVDASLTLSDHQHMLSRLLTGEWQPNGELRVSSASMDVLKRFY